MFLRHAFLPVLFVVAAASAVDGQTIWTGAPIEFTKEAFADFTLAENQDRITDRVWLTRQNAQGIYNAALEPSYNQLFSTAPEDTEWATGTTADLANLNFTTWREWAGINTGMGLDVVNRPSVLHLITEDIYIDITFTSWNGGSVNGGSGGGGFSYIRSTAVPEPGSALLLTLAGAAATFGSRPRRRQSSL